MYAGTRKIYKQYWTAYGGWKELVRSFYLLVALVLLPLTLPTWWTPTWENGQWSAWWDHSLSVLPNLLGFTLGGFAIFLGFGDEKFRQLLSESDDGEAIEEIAYVGLCATFVHFIVIQTLALLFAVVAKSWWFYAEWMAPLRAYLPFLNALGGAFGYGLFMYALTSVIAATMHVFRIAILYANFRRMPQNEHCPHCGKPLP